MTEIPDPRADGKCADCCGRRAETHDGRFCKKCLRRRIAMENPIERRAHRKIKPMKGRTDSLAVDAQGGAPREMLEDPDDI